MPRFLDTRYEDGRDNPFDHERNGEFEESNSASLIRNSTSKKFIEEGKITLYSSKRSRAAISRSELFRYFS